LRPKRRTTRSGGGSRAPARLVAVTVILFWLTQPSGAQPSATQAKPGQASYAVVAGTVFQDDGRLLRGAQVTLRPDPEGGPAPRGKTLTAATDQRGEFAFRLPAGAMRYNLSVKALGFREQEKIVSVSGDERVDVFFQLERNESAK